MPVNPLFKFGENFNAAPDDAKFFWSGGPTDMGERTYFASMFSGVIAFDTDEGVVLVDSGLKRNAEPLAAMIRAKTDAPIHTAIFTQGHVDHAFGLKAFFGPGPTAASGGGPPQYAGSLFALRENSGPQHRHQRTTVRGRGPSL